MDTHANDRIKYINIRCKKCNQVLSVFPNSEREYIDAISAECGLFDTDNYLAHDNCTREEGEKRYYTLFSTSDKPLSDAVRVIEPPIIEE